MSADQHRNKSYTPNTRKVHQFEKVDKLEISYIDEQIFLFLSVFRYLALGKKI